MATQIVCDGCSIPLYKMAEATAVERANGRELMVQGRRANGMLGGDPLPQGEFHWCERCAKIAFKAIRDARLRAAQLRDVRLQTAERIRVEEGKWSPMT